MLKKRVLPVLALLAFSQAAFGQIHVYRGGGYLGVDIRDVLDDDARDLRLARAKGVVVESVAADSAAEDAGLQSGDVILGFGGTEVISVRQLQRLVSDTPVGRTVDLEISRNGQTMTLQAQLHERKTLGRLQGFTMPDLHLDELNLREHLGEWRNYLPDDLDFDFDFDFEGLGDGNRFVIMSSRPKLGISGTPLTSQMADFLKVPQQTGILVTEVFDDSPADRAGLKAGDVIVSIGGEPVESPHRLSRSLRKGGGQIEIYRGGRSMTLDIEIESKQKSVPKKSDRKL